MSSIEVKGWLASVDQIVNLVRESQNCRTDAFVLSSQKVRGSDKMGFINEDEDSGPRLTI